MLKRMLDYSNIIYRCVNISLSKPFKTKGLPMNELNTNILKDLDEYGKIAKAYITELDTNKENPLTISYIKLDDDLLNKWDNTLLTNMDARNHITYIYNALIRILNEKYKSDNLSIFYRYNKLKLVYLACGAIIKTIV